MDDAGDEMEVVDPNAVRKQVNQITSSGGILFRRVPTAEILNNNMLLKSLCLILYIGDLL